MKQILYYQKPEEICQDPNIFSELISSGNFIRTYKHTIEEKLGSRNLSLRLASVDDIFTIQELINKCYSKEAARDSNPYDFYRFISYGHGLLVEDCSRKLIGCLFEEAYDSSDRTSYTLRLAIDHETTCKELGTLLLEYSCLLAMERGSKVKRGLLLSNNFISTHILINKLGWICDNYYPDLKWVSPSFTISLPLTPESFIKNRVDMKKLLEYIAKSSSGSKCFKLIEWDDQAGLTKLFEDGYVILAFIKEGIISQKHLYVGFPADKIKALSVKEHI